MRRYTASGAGFVAAGVVVAMLAATTVAGAEQSPAEPPVEVWNILPPGQSGTVDALDLAGVLLGDPANRIAVDGRNAPENFADQLERYDALNTRDPATITEAELGDYFKPAGLDVPAERVASVEHPRPGVTITRDTDGVAHVVGVTDDDVAWGAGFAGTQDRMFLQDVLRHAGAARAAEFLGPTDENVAMDVDQLRSAFYTEQEAADQVVAAAARHGAAGARLLGQVDAFLAGINAAQGRMCPVGPAGPACPAEYVALGRTPEPWTRADLTYLASLIGGIFGRGGGQEAGNAEWLQRLVQRFGSDEGRRVYDDLRFADAQDAPATGSRSFDYGRESGVNPGLSGVALPDLEPAGTAPGTGARLDHAGPLPASPGVLTGPFGPIDLRGGLGMSNAALVSGDRTPDGHPIAVFGPQTGYYTPQLLSEVSLRGPNIAARGVAFAGLGFLVQIGRGTDYAWSATSAGSDNTDTVVERLCEPSGAAPTVESTHYLRDGRCVPLERHEHRELALPTVAAPAAPADLRFLVLRSHHGIVQQRTTVDGEPVALVAQRSTYGREVDSVAGFAAFNDPNRITGPESFAAAAAQIEFTFNWFYVDERDISFYSSGRLPVRSGDVDPDLPRWADPRYAWQGWLSDDAHPHDTNPPSGQLVNWNNKPAPDFGAADDNWGHGPVHRSQPLDDRVRDVGTLAELVGAVTDAATVDTRAERVLPALLDAIGTVDPGADPVLAEAVSLLRDWAGHREDRDRDGAYTDQAAIAVFDQWWADGAAADVLRGTLGDLADRLPTAPDDHPSLGQGSAFNNVAAYGHVVADLTGGQWHRRYCGGGDATRCAEQLRGSLRAAVGRAMTAQDVTSPSALRYDKSRDFITPVGAGVVGTRPIDWQNRPTFQQVVRFR